LKSPAEDQLFVVTITITISPQRMTKTLYPAIYTM